MGLKYSIEDIPADLKSIASKYRQELVENIANYNDEILNKYVENSDISQEELIAAIREITLSGKGIPALCGASFKNKGVQFLLDAVIDYLPSPLDVPSPLGINPYTEKEENRKASDEEAFSGLLFKIMTDPFVGKLSFVRVYSGILK